jgi:hypothetical protein
MARIELLRFYEAAKEMEFYMLVKSQPSFKEHSEIMKVIPSCKVYLLQFLQLRFQILRRQGLLEVQDCR